MSDVSIERCEDKPKSRKRSPIFESERAMQLEAEE